MPVRVLIEKSIETVTGAAEAHTYYRPHYRQLELGFTSTVTDLASIIGKTNLRRE